MTKPWVLLASAAFSVGALFGWIGGVAFALVTLIVAGGARQRPFVVTAIALSFAILGAYRTAEWDPPSIPSSVAESQAAEGIVRDVPQIGPSGPRAVVSVERVQLPDEAWVTASGEVLVFFHDAAPSGVQKGDRLRLRWSVTSLQQTEPGFRTFVASQDAGGYAWAFSASIIARGGSPANVLVRLRNFVTDRIETAIGGDAGALIAGFVTGDDSGLSDEVRSAFDLTNTSHVTAVSGANVAVLIVMWSTVIPNRRVKRALPIQLALICLIWSYVVLVGLSAAAVRAGLFASLMVPASRLGRKPDPMTALMLTSALMLLFEPALSLNVGFWLSMAATTALVTTIGPLEEPAPGRLKHALIGLVAAQLATFPVVLVVFGGWSPSSLLANLFIGPLVALVFPVAFVVAAIVTVAPWATGLVGWIPELLANTIIAVVQSLAGEFPMIRPGPVSATYILLVSLLCVSVIAALSSDVRRWLDRIDFTYSDHRSLIGACLVGVCAGVWIAAVAVT